MPGQQISSAKDLLAHAAAPADIRLDCSVMQKGIDNYAIDIELDSRFLARTRRVLQELVKRVVGGRRPNADADLIDAMREAYVDMVNVSLHRTKTNFDPAQVRICHFGIIKFIVSEVRDQIEAHVRQVEETLGQQQFAGSRSLLVTQERFAWLRKHSAAFQYRATRAMFRQLQREETSQLRPLREQFLGDDLIELPNILLNPMLAVTSPMLPQLTLDSYMMWTGNADAFCDAIAELEKYLAGRLPELALTPLRAPAKSLVGDTEIYDQLGGIFGAQPILGAATDQKDEVNEQFCWLDQPANIRLLFDASVHERMIGNVHGWRATREFKSLTRKLQKIGMEARSRFVGDARAREMVAGYIMREDWAAANEDIIDLPSACAYVAGNDSRKILAKIDQSREGAPALIKQMDEWAKELNRRFKEESTEFSLRILTDLSRFRLHLKYYRFAHRMFNRLNVITAPDQIQLSRAGGHLYRLLGADQSKSAESAEPEIVHHTIIKADVRGSTVVTEELIKQSLNPASYFSTRLFRPISDLLDVYGAVKVFIEGDAVILAIYEHDVDPGQWYSVSRACGIARQILDIVASKNAHARQTGIPALEIGIGICYSDDKPMFLFDDDKPIMISSAIGEADRMSSCSWNLRETFAGGQFNVEVLEIAEGDRQRGEKGQHFARYNVNGVMLGTAAFRKLKSEIRLRKLKVKAGKTTQTVYVGQFPDMVGKVRDLVIREGVVGVWREGEVQLGQEGGEPFYEVLPNSKFTSQVLELARNQAAK